MVPRQGSHKVSYQFLNVDASIFSSELFEDPDGVLPLSIKQMKHFK